MKVIAFRNPWPFLILNGKKTMDIRHSSTKYKGYFAMYQSLSRPTVDDMDYFNHDLGFSESPDDFEYGFITAVGKLTDSIRLDTVDKFLSYQLHHCLDLSYFDNRLHGWSIPEVIPLPRLLPFKMPKGSVGWSSVPDERLLSCGLSPEVLTDEFNS